MDRQRRAAAGVKSVFRALDHRNFKLFFAGQGISLIGTWTQQIAISWLVYRMTDSPFLLGLVGFSGQIPVFLLSAPAGVLVDRWNRHRTLIATQFLSMLQAIILAVLVLSGKITVELIIFLALSLGLVNAVDVPNRQSFLVDMIGKKEDLPNAIALNSSMFNGARLIGPTVAGLLIAAVGEGICFLINAVSFIAVIASLFAMTDIPTRPTAQHAQFLRGLKEGFRYVFGFTPIRYLLILLGLTSLMGMPFAVLMPVFAKNVLHGGPHTFGFLMGAVGVGALSGAIFLASRKSVIGLGKIIVASSAVFGIGLVALSLTRSLIPSLVLLAAAGFGMMVQTASTNTIIQTIVEEDKRGRVMSFYAMVLLGMTPLGSLLAGTMVNVIGVQGMLGIGGGFCFLGSVLFARRLPSIRKLIRPIYRKKGIIPEVIPEPAGPMTPAP
jgi:MFS family permease